MSTSYNFYKNEDLRTRSGTSARCHLNLVSPYSRPNIDFNRLSQANKTMNNYGLSVRFNKNIDFTMEADKQNNYKENRFVRKSPSYKSFNTELEPGYKTSKNGTFNFQSFRNERAHMPHTDTNFYGNYKEKLASIVTNFKNKENNNEVISNIKRELHQNNTADLLKEANKIINEKNSVTSKMDYQKKDVQLYKSQEKDVQAYKAQEKDVQLYKSQEKDEESKKAERNSLRKRPLSTQNNTSKAKLVNYELTNSNERSKGIVEAFGICTTNGIHRNYNEDRVSVILNAIKQVENINTEETTDQDKEKIENQIIQNSHCSYFSIFDGHGGNKCANYLRENQHSFIFNDENFPVDVKKSIENGIFQAEKEFIDNFKNKTNTDDKNNLFDKSGSCALLALFIKETCYIANVGDSRAVISIDRGSTKKNVTIDHKPESKCEFDRIYKAGGSVYRSKNPTVFSNLFGTSNKFNIGNYGVSPYKKASNKFSEDCTSKKAFGQVGPERVFPGKLSVSRTIGDIYAKDRALGGNPNVVIPNPDVFVLDLSTKEDFIIMASDGIFDMVSTNQVINIAWDEIKSFITETKNEISSKNKLENDEISEKKNIEIDVIHDLSKKIAEKVVLKAMDKKSNDNQTVVFIALPGLYEHLQASILADNKNMSITENITENLSKPLRKITENMNEDLILEKNRPIHFSKESLELLANDTIQIEEKEVKPRIEDPKRALSFDGGHDININHYNFERFNEATNYDNLMKKDENKLLEKDVESKNQNENYTKYQRSSRSKKLQKSLEINQKSYKENSTLASRPNKTPVRCQAFSNQFLNEKSTYNFEKSTLNFDKSTLNFDKSSQNCEKNQTTNSHNMYLSQTSDFYSKYMTNHEKNKSSSQKFDNALTISDSYRNQTSDVLRKYDDQKFVLHINKRYNMAAKFNPRFNVQKFNNVI